MARFAAGIPILIAVFWISLSGQAPDSRLQDADLAWERGDYQAALEQYRSLLDSPDGAKYVEPIALQTGEWFDTLQLTDDGGTPRFAPDGGHFSYEVGRGLTRATRVASTRAPASVVAELPGYGAAFSPDGTRVAYLRLTATRELLNLERSADQAAGAERTKLLTGLARQIELAARITIREIASGVERTLDIAPRKNAVLLAAGTAVLFTGGDGDGPDQVYLSLDGRSPRVITSGDADKILHSVNADGSSAMFIERAQTGRGRGAAPARFGIVALPQGNVTLISGSAPSFSRRGRHFAYVGRGDTQYQLLHASVDAPTVTSAARSGPERVDAPSWSPDGLRLAFQIMPGQDWDVHVVGIDGTGETRITREIQHDVQPRFLDETRLLALVGEPRHRRSYLYDLAAHRRIRLFHNNTVRTIAPEYGWTPSPDGARMIIVADRDGDTVSPERGVYLMDLSKTVTASDLRARLAANLEAERALSARTARLYGPIADLVRRVTAEVSIPRIFGYQKALVDLDSRHITRPGNRLAAEYLSRTYQSFGYEPRYQWFSPRGALGGQTANVLATLKGTTNPELVYVVSSHYDTIADGPGADDNAAGTAVLLEVARILARQPQPATIVFASFTGEESGLLGSREFVRLAVEDKTRIVGALNNDIIGWTNDHRLDSTIRYSNPGIRDVQHAAAGLFTNLITYDALYYRGTDAQAYYEAYGDIVGGLAQYPVLGNPHYHQAHDTLDTINHQLVAEVAKATAATVMLLASSPSRLKDLEVRRQQDSVAVSWTPGPERGISAYVVSWGTADQREAQQLRVTRPAATIKAAAGAWVSVRAVNEQGLESWDAARAIVPGR